MYILSSGTRNGDELGGSVIWCPVIEVTKLFSEPLCTMYFKLDVQ